MSSRVSRRSFLKLLSLCPFLFAESHRVGLSTNPSDSLGTQPNILILLFDAFSASHASLCGYSRRTTPNLERFAERATVYHNHISAGNYTNPGTASLLTGTYPWTHRSMALYSQIAETFSTRNLFSVFSPDYYTLAYSHNLIPVAFFYQLVEAIDEIKEVGDLCMMSRHEADKLFKSDYEVAVWMERKFEQSKHLPSSVGYSLLNSALWHSKRSCLNERYRSVYPRDVPHTEDLVFRLEDAIDWLSENLSELPKPYLAYMHLMPPHNPYCPRCEFIGRFDDGWAPNSKPANEFSQGIPKRVLDQQRIYYDEYVAYVDAEFGRLYDSLDAQGMLDDTILLVTSDHGELFERGIGMHSTEVLYEPIVRIPLLISQPGQSKHRDVSMPTSSIDVMPTLCEMVGKQIPEWCEGRVLPLSDAEPTEAESSRPIYSVDSKSAPRRGPLSQGSIMLRQAAYKLIHYFGYSNLKEAYELYNLDQDPEERVNLIEAEQKIGRRMQDRLLAQLNQIGVVDS